MVMCAPDCDCRWCRLTEMSMHRLFKDRVDALLAEFTPVWMDLRRTRYENMLVRMEADEA